MKRLFLFLLLWVTSCQSPFSEKVYHIGIDPDWYAMNFMEKTPYVSAFSTELLREIGKEANLSLITINTTHEKLVPQLEQEAYDAILSSMEPHLFNEARFGFSDLYLETGPVLVLPYESSFGSLKDLAGKEIAVMKNSDALFLEGESEILIRSYDSIPQALSDITTNVIDGALIDVLIADSYCNDLYEEQLKIVTPPFGEQGLRLIEKDQKNQELVTSFNKALRKMKKNGSYAKLLKKWSLPEPD